MPPSNSLLVHSLAALLAATCSLSVAAEGTNVSTYAGGGPVAGTALGMTLRAAERVTVDGQGRVLFTAPEQSRVYRVGPGGTFESLVGNGAGSGPTLGLPADLATLGSPGGVAVDGSGRVYVSNNWPPQVFRLDHPGAPLVLVAGNGSYASSGDGGPATAASLEGAIDLALDGTGNLYILEKGRVRRVAADTRIISTVAGDGGQGYAGDGGPATAATFYQPWGIDVDAAGNILVADSVNHRVRLVSASSGLIETIAGDGNWGSGGDGGPATQAQISLPTGVAFDGQGILIADASSSRIRRVDRSTGLITTVAGGSYGYGGDGGPATSAQLASPSDVAAGPGGSFFIADFYNGRVRAVAGGLISTLAGGGYPGDGRPAAEAVLNFPTAILASGSGLFVAEANAHLVRRIDQVTGLVTTIAGQPGQFSGGYNGDDRPALGALLSGPSGLAMDAAGDLYIADTFNHRIRRVHDGIITTFAGTGEAGADGDGGPAALAQLNQPRGLAFDAAGDLYVADQFNHRIRRIDPSGQIETVAGTGSPGYSGDGGPALQAQLNYPVGVAVDSSGLYIADQSNGCVRRVQLNRLHRIDTVWPELAYGLLPDGGRMLVAAGNRVVALDESSLSATTLAGDGTWRYAGDGGDALRASFASASALAHDPSGALWVADAGSNRVRRIYERAEKGDLDGDRRADLLFHEEGTGHHMYWAMAEAARLAQAPVVPDAELGWPVAGMGDFLADGRNDLVLRDESSGAVRFWAMNGATRLAVAELAEAPGPEWDLAGVADCDGDGRPDLVWQERSSSRVEVWAMDGTRRRDVIEPKPSQASPGWRLVGVADLNGDGAVDFLWFNGSSRRLVRWLLGPQMQRLVGEFTSPNAGPAGTWQPVALGDYGVGPGGAAGTPDILWRNDDSGRLAVWHMDAAGVRTAGRFTTPAAPDQAPTAWHVVAPR